MDISQIITLIVFFTIFFISFSWMVSKVNKEDLGMNFLFSMLGLLVPFLIIMMLVVSLLHARAEFFSDKPCGEYEKIENVYIRK